MQFKTKDKFSKFLRDRARILKLCHVEFKFREGRELLYRIKASLNKLIFTLLHKFFNLWID